MKHALPVARRGFLKNATMAAVAPFVSRLSWAQGSPMQKLQYAAIGAGGRGTPDIGSMTGHKKVQMVAAADVDSSVFPKLTAKHTGINTFSDWREMLQSMNGEIDVVGISTPDHMHGIQAVSAMNLGKHVYVQKPLAQTIGECRSMQHAAHQNNVVVQMGTQGASSLNDRMAVNLVRRQLIGKISEAWVFCGKSWGDSKPLPDQQDPVPEGLDWDGWLGIGEKRPYVDKYYHPKNWRRRQEYGSGTLGDMGCHIFNAMYRGLELTAPTKVRSNTAVPNQHNWTSDERVEYSFPGTEYTEADLKVTWVSGSERAPEELTSIIPDGVKYRFGCLLKGSEGTLLLRHGSSPMLLPEQRYSNFVPDKLEGTGHHAGFIDAIIEGKTDSLMSPIEFAAPLTEFILLGNIAMQHTPNWLEWDCEEAKIPNNDAASRHVHRTYRSGWEVLKA